MLAADEERRMASVEESDALASASADTPSAALEGTADSAVLLAGAGAHARQLATIAAPSARAATRIPVTTTSQRQSAASLLLGNIHPLRTWFPLAGEFAMKRLVHCQLSWGSTGSASGADLHAFATRHRTRRRYRLTITIESLAATGREASKPYR
jgi:hypothetical protein